MNSSKLSIIPKLLFKNETLVIENENILKLELNCLLNDLKILLNETKLLNYTTILTPKYIMSSKLLELTLVRHFKFFQNILNSINYNVNDVNESNSVNEVKSNGLDLHLIEYNSTNEFGDSKQLRFQLYLSIKTQPSIELLLLAYKNHFHVECINLAEVFHVLSNSDYQLNQVILTGPGKWWHNLSIDSKEYTRFHQILLTQSFNGIYADSLNDLNIIINDIINHKINTNIIGIRWTPAWPINSRFGLNCNNSQVIASTVQSIKQLLLTHSNISIGMHFHYAESTLSSKKWFDSIKSFLIFCKEFSILLNNHPISNIDFGGGFSPYFINNKNTKEYFTKLFSELKYLFVDHQPILPIIQFEPGKSISEIAGGIITRILSIRDWNTNENNHKPNSTFVSDRDEKVDNEDDPTLAVVVDTAINDISSPHLHPIFILRKNSENENYWLLLESGKSVIWYVIL